MKQSNIGRPIPESVSSVRKRINGYNREYYERNKDEILRRKREKMRQYRAQNPEKHLKQSKEAKARLRERLFEMYGQTCCICGFSDKRALTLDHINQNGNKERKELGERGVWQRARDNFLPTEYRTLCMNCQFIERHKYGNEN